jgi:hypothetical protein
VVEAGTPEELGLDRDLRRVFGASYWGLIMSYCNTHDWTDTDLFMSEINITKFGMSPSGWPYYRGDFVYYYMFMYQGLEREIAVYLETNTDREYRVSAMVESPTGTWETGYDSGWFRPVKGQHRLYSKSLVQVRGVLEAHGVDL